MDRRVRKTQTAIKKAFFELLKEKGIEGVKVSRICELADINRGTFYLNYIDKYDLLEKTISESIDELIEKCEADAADPVNLMALTFQYIIEHKGYYKVLIEADKQGHFSDYLNRHILNFSSAQEIGNNTETIFISNGIIGVLNYYLSSNSTSGEMLNDVSRILKKFQGDNELLAKLSNFK
ncbi:TetR/AcrR family transcriptional regulator [Pediococcus argentinicus]|uniref:HTH tetR-type domain-containing protein n=1 Tax=Pediococcus argentinicus TaxID=480391 RepID=A0A0R2NJP6_9LACO|nr:TetR family transcriptional regulator [Pediococcus argentinicus]KRO25989.1 hypothetical protein IV88_GL001257 [Pediococcus argentinicus]NKZ21761.1 TetR family transcriptional regulator [Pediococcus argentinicus]GEP18981.1 TetR family transcriptional regulator [Pediococcus argentinicus]